MPPRRPAAAPAARLSRFAPLAALALLAAACGGDGGGVTAPPPNSTQARFDVTTQAALASGTTNVRVRFVPTYTNASGAAVALPAGTSSGGAAQTFSTTVDLAGCLGAAGAAGSCTVNAAAVMQSEAGVTLDSVTLAPIVVKGGETRAVAVSFVQVTGVSVTREGGGALTPPVTLQVGQTLDLTATATATGGAPVARPVGWASSAPGVATVDAATGVITAVGPGTARISVTAGGQTTTVDVTVQAPLAVTLAGTGAGNVKSAPAGVDCTTGATTGCAGAFSPGANVTLTASPDANSTFTGWSGDCTGAGDCVVAPDRARAVTATFGRKRVTLTVTATNGGGTGDVLVTGGNVAPATPCAAATCAYTVDAGVTVNITARPATSSLVGTWTAACAGTTGATCSRQLTADAAAGVTFTSTDLVGVTATSSTGAVLGGSFDFQGTVNGSPVTPAAITINTTTAQTGFAFDRNSSVTIRFLARADSRLVSWGGVCQGTAVVDPTGLSSCTFTTTANTAVVINLAPR